MVRMNFIFIFISSSDTNLLRKKSVKQEIKKPWPNGKKEKDCHSKFGRTYYESVLTFVNFIDVSTKGNHTQT